MQFGVEVEVFKVQKDEFIFQGNFFEVVFQSVVDIQQICRVWNKDICKVCEGFSYGGLIVILLQCYEEDKVYGVNIVFSFWMVFMFLRRVMLRRSKENDYGFFCVLWGYIGVVRGYGYLYIFCSVKKCCW